MKILVADDSKTNLAMITASLNKLGHEVLGASSGEEAIDFAKKDRPDLIILDVVMQGMDGFECAKQIRLINESDWIPIIFLSASVDDDSIEKGINAGGDDYLTKPFSEITLAAKIKAMQRIAEMRQKLFQMTEELKILSSTDVLTELYNRFQFEKTVKEKLAESDRYQNGVTLMFIDLDHFKTINDSFGHHIGDLLLKEVASRLRKNFGLEDFIARLGGDEFVVLLSHTDNLKTAEEIAKKVNKSLAEIYQIGTHSVRISASIGVAFYPSPGITHESFVQNADIAMYHAKAMGRNNYQMYNADLNLKYKKQINIEHELKFALDRNQLNLTYQPIHHLLSKKVIGMEALARWNHPEFGAISPNIFIPIAEETGLILEIGSWVLNEACSKAAKWYHEGYKDLKFSVNLSLHQFLQDNFFEVVVDILNRHNLPPKVLELELTETTVITYTNYFKSTIKKLYEIGIGISIDDFGTRYSSLTSLKYLPITTLKIDKTFLKEVTTDPKNEIIVKSLIALGSSLNLTVIAEGVQSEEQEQFLILNGCMHGQGYLLSKALTHEEMSKYLENNLKTSIKER